MRLIVVLFLLLAMPAHADKCLVLWDMALVSRAMVEEGASGGMVAGTLNRIYRAPQNVISDLTVLALQSTAPAREFAIGLRASCEKTVKRTPGAASSV